MDTLASWAGVVAMTFISNRIWLERIIGGCLAGLFAVAVLVGASASARASTCPPPTSLGTKPTHLLVVVPATGQGTADWQSFLEAFKKEPHSADYAWLVFDHGVGFGTIGTARDVA